MWWPCCVINGMTVLLLHATLINCLHDKGRCCCSPCHFFRLGTAHILLLGLLKDFWTQWIPGKKERAEGPLRKYTLSRRICRQITARAPKIMQTGQFKKVYTDIIKCVRQYECYASTHCGGARN